MKDRNICKFPAPSVFNMLNISRFVLETNEDVKKYEVKLDANRVVLVVCGEGDFNISGKDISYTAGNLIFAFENEVVSCKEKTKTEYFYIDFGGLRAEELLARFGISNSNRLFSGFDGIVPMWKESLSRANENTIDLASEGILLYTFSRIVETNVMKNSVVNQMIKMVDASFTDMQFSLNTIANELSYNPKYLSRLFKINIGIGFNEYLTNARIKYAIALFESGIDSIKNVAVLSGFSDPLYFSTVFKKIAGISPKEFLKSR